jgi:hypothetical protein
VVLSGRLQFVEGSVDRAIGGAGSILKSWVTSGANPGLDIPPTAPPIVDIIQSDADVSSVKKERDISHAEKKLLERNGNIHDVVMNVCGREKNQPSVMLLFGLGWKTGCVACCDLL